jgi:hypothetical protein
MKKLIYILLFSIASLSHAEHYSEKEIPVNLERSTFLLKDQLAKAAKGDYLVSFQNKMNTVLHVKDKFPDSLVIEEISIPASKAPFSWKEWVREGAPGNSSWIIYTVDFSSGKISDYYLLSRNIPLNPEKEGRFISTLLNMEMSLIPEKERRKVGSHPVYAHRDKRPVWQPKMVFEGEAIPGVYFDAWRAEWPKDGTPFAGKTIKIFTPRDPRFPSYFPYKLEAGGLISGEIRIIDSGRSMESPVFSKSYQHPEVHFSAN